MSYLDCIYYHKPSNKIYVDVDELHKQFTKQGTILSFMLDNEISYSYLSDTFLDNKKLISYSRLFNLQNNTKPNLTDEFNKFNKNQQHILKQLLIFMQKISKGEITLTEKNGDELMLSYYPKLS
jgi:hypothetical protein